jgi:hypothetical protein
MQVGRFAALVTMALGACSGGSDDGGAQVPSLIALSKDEISVGDSLEFIGEGYLRGAEGFTEVVLDGDYVTDKATYPVSLRFRPEVSSATRLVWQHFGPYDIPFSPAGNELGVFDGTATAVNVGADGSEVASAPLAVSLRVGPSVLIRALEPVAADCDEPAARLLGGFRYRLVAEAVGIEPVEFTLELLDEPGAGDGRVLHQDAVDAVASFGEDGDLILAPAADGRSSYVMRVRTTARDAGGQELDSEYALGVHRPLEYIDLGRPEPGEIENAVPVSGCHSGAESGRQLAYAESTTDVRERQLGLSWNESWMESHGDQFSPPEANQVSLRIRESETDGFTVDWKDGDVIVGQVGVSQAAEWALRQAGDVEIGAAGFWQIASSDLIPGDTSADLLGDMFGVWYRQTTRLVRPGNIAAYDLCGQAQPTADASFIDYTWTTALAQAAECPPFPQPELPPAECYIAPCTQ